MRNPSSRENNDLILGKPQPDLDQLEGNFLRVLGQKHPVRVKEPCPERWGRERKITDEASHFLSLISHVLSRVGPCQQALSCGSPRCFSQALPGAKPPSPSSTASGGGCWGDSSLAANSSPTAAVPTTPQNQHLYKHMDGYIYIYIHKPT